MRGVAVKTVLVCHICWYVYMSIYARVLLDKLCVWCFGTVELVQVQERPDEAFNGWDEGEKDRCVGCLSMLLQ